MITARIVEAYPRRERPGVFLPSQLDLLPCVDERRCSVFRRGRVRVRPLRPDEVRLLRRVDVVASVQFVVKRKADGRLEVDGARAG